MNLPLFIARRYFFSKKSQRAINIISIISVIGVMIGTGALIVVLSVFNGFESLVVSLYNSFDPELKITVAEGKTFPADSAFIYQLKNIEGVESISQTLEENALVKYREKQYIVTIKGIDENYPKVSGIKSKISDGEFEMQHGDTDFAIVGGAIASNLQLNITNYLSQLELFAPQKNATSLSNPEEAFNRRFITPAGVFSIQQEFDSKYIGAAGPPIPRFAGGPEQRPRHPGGVLCRLVRGLPGDGAGDGGPGAPTPRQPQCGAAECG